MKKIMTFSWLSLLLLLIGGLFWYTDWMYQRPTPIPAGYLATPRGAAIDLRGLDGERRSPVLLHFFNPDCPCSRFNIPMFKRLYSQYNGRVNFIIVVLSRQPFNARSIRQRFGLNGVKMIADSTLAKACGVYSTPQVVLLDSHHKLYYRGNYNRNRYCTDDRTNYARIALSTLLAHRPYPAFSLWATRSYGCGLPHCIR